MRQILPCLIPRSTRFFWLDARISWTGRPSDPTYSTKHYCAHSTIVNSSYHGYQSIYALQSYEEYYRKYLTRLKFEITFLLKRTELIPTAKPRRWFLSQLTKTLTPCARRTRNAQFNGALIVLFRSIRLDRMPHKWIYLLVSELLALSGLRFAVEFTLPNCKKSKKRWKNRKKQFAICFLSMLLHWIAKTWPTLFLDTCWQAYLNFSQYTNLASILGSIVHIVYWFSKIQNMGWLLNAFTIKHHYHWKFANDII